jgi:transposase
MQKALVQMNIQLGSVISDVAGATGQKIVRAIVQGERDPRELAAYRDCRIKASEEEIAASLQGNWRAEHLFELKQALQAHDFCAQLLAECDQEIERVMRELARHEGRLDKSPRRSKNRNAPKFDVRQALYEICGVDLTRIDGIDASTALAVISEIGADMSRFKTVKHFTSWLGLCPGTRISGGKELGSATKRSANRARQALKLAAAALRSSKSSLGAYYRRMCARMDKGKAVTAAAHKLARYIYTMLTKGQDYVDQGQLYYEERYRERVLRQMTKRASELGFRLVPAGTA